MIEIIQEDQWVWVIVQDPGENEQFFGQYDEERDVSFIPVFLDKENAQQGLIQLGVMKGHRYECQAIRLEYLKRHTAKNGFMLFVLNEAGEVLEKIEAEGS